MLFLAWLLLLDMFSDLGLSWAEMWSNLGGDTYRLTTPAAFFLLLLNTLQLDSLVISKSLDFCIPLLRFGFFSTWWLLQSHLGKLTVAASMRLADATLLPPSKCAAVG
jgi:hypothetical protein